MRLIVRVWRLVERIEGRPVHPLERAMILLMALGGLIAAWALVDVALRR